MRYCLRHCPHSRDSFGDSETAPSRFISERWMKSCTDPIACLILVVIMHGLISTSTRSFSYNSSTFFASLLSTKYETRAARCFSRSGSLSDLAFSNHWSLSSRALTRALMSAAHFCSSVLSIPGLVQARAWSADAPRWSNILKAAWRRRSACSSL